MISNQSITVVAESMAEIKSVIGTDPRIINKSSLSKRVIPGLIAQQLSVPKSISTIAELRQILPSKRLWVDVEGADVPSIPPLFRESIVTLGSLGDISTYNYHHGVGGIGIEFNKDRGEIFIIKKPFRLRLAKDCLDTYFVIDPSKTFFLPLKKPVRCFSKLSGSFPQRCFDFTEAVTASDLGKTNTIAIHYLQNGDELRRFLVEEFELKCFYSLPPTSMKLIESNTENQLAASTDFLSNYAWQMVLSLGYRIRDRLTIRLMYEINKMARYSRNDVYPNNRFYQKMVAIYNAARNNQFFSIEQQWHRIKPQWVPQLQTGYEYMPRIFLTPYGQYPRTLKPLRSNRVLRQSQRFGPAIEHYCRVLLRDCDLSSIQSDVITAWRPQLKRMLLQDGLSIGQRQYDFLLFSNSQLRDRSLCFYRSFHGNTAEDIRQWLGQFNHEKSIGTRIARMAQCFTSTIKGIQLQEHQLIRIDDVFDARRRCFTDGCGRISTSLLQKQFSRMDRGESIRTRPPSVVQIRCGGLKGVLVDAPDLQGDVIQYRPSQAKFHSTHLELEIINFSQDKPISLNRQLIALLEYMGIDSSIFVELQNIYRKTLSMALLCKKSAVSFLRRTVRYYDWEHMYDSGIPITQEPFIRSLLMTLCRDRLQRLRDKTHIPIPMKDGRVLYGVVDDTNSLQYGEVFIQISDETADDGETQRVVTAERVLVTRMPCHHPGDVRLLRAVDKPRLHHLVDCIVFPAKGHRPHPTEMSGGDLDGDEYWACWNDKLVGQVKHLYEPAEYTSPEKTKITGEPTMEMMVDFILDILVNGDQVGVLSRRHLALCTRHNPAHPQAITLAQHISDSLDFPKTGVSSMTPALFRRLNVREYPDFMQNKMKETFESDKVLGILYRHVIETLTIHSSLNDTAQTPIVYQDLLVDGYQEYLREAQMDYLDYCEKIHVIMNTYDLQQEAELITGCHFGMPEEQQNNDDVETASQEFRSLRMHFKRTFDDKMADRSMLDRERKVSAYYYVAYSPPRENETDPNDGPPEQACLSFPWIWHELLCQIKENKMSRSTLAPSHQSLERIGKALADAYGDIPATDANFIIYLAYNEMVNMALSEAKRIECLRMIIHSCETHEKFLSSQDSHESLNQRLAEQFLAMIEVLSESRENGGILQAIANTFLTKLHRIAITGSV